MLNQKELKVKTISELKKIADSNKIKYTDKAKKEDLIKLILKSQTKTVSKPKAVKSGKKETIEKPAKAKAVDIKINTQKKQTITKKQQPITASNGILPDNY